MQNFTEADQLQGLLDRATRAKEVIIRTKIKHRSLIDEIKERRNKLMIEMTEQIDGSVAQLAIEREIDSLDQREVSLHSDFKKILSTADKQINEIIAESMRLRFGPNWNSDKTMEHAQHDEF